jgi:hypothetical protein
VGLPSSASALTRSPPLRTDATIFRDEAAVRGPLESKERIDVALSPTGSVVGVRVRQRLVVLRKGDYALVVQAPATDVEAAPGSESQPGLRRGAIVWSGFSPGRRVLVADARLDAASAAFFLPVRVRLVATHARTTLELWNATTTHALSYSADADPDQAAAALERIRAAVAHDREVPASSVTARGETSKVAVTTTAPLRVEGELRAVGGGFRHRFAATLGDGRPNRLRIVVPGHRLPLLSLRVRPVPPRRLLATSRGAPRTGGRRLFDRAFAAIRTLALARQYRQFLANPDPVGTSAAVYVFRTTTQHEAAPPAAQPARSHTARTVLVLVLAAAAVGGLAVLWAHS